MAVQKCAVGWTEETAAQWAVQSVLLGGEDHKTIM